MPGFQFRQYPSVWRGALAGVFTIFAAGAAMTGAAAAAAPTQGLAWMDLAWQGGADWREPAPASGHGPIKPDPAHPYVSNAERGQSTSRIPDTKDPVLKPWAAAQMLASNEEVFSGKLDVPFVAQSRCWPGGVPGQLLFPAEPLTFLHTPKEVWMVWQRDHMVRRVFMKTEHAKNLTPSWFGESIGHYEDGDTFVIDTIGLSTRNSYIDNFRTPHSEKEHVVERFKMAPDGETLLASVTVEDPDTFNEPIHMMNRWRLAPNQYAESVCAENTVDYFHQKLFPFPEARTPDF